jgi:hypothetical protein
MIKIQELKLYMKNKITSLHLEWNGLVVRLFLSPLRDVNSSPIV